MNRLITTLLATLLLLVIEHAQAADAPRVTKLRLSEVTLFDAANGNPTGEKKSRDQYVPGSWQVVGGPEAGFVKINGEGKTFWVKSLAIDTDQRVAITAECNVKIGGSSEKIGATRALGEECKK